MEMNEVNKILNNALSPVECPSELLNMRVRNAKMEGKSMGNMKRGRVIILAAAICLILGTVAFAAGIGGYITSTTNPMKAETNYDRIDKIAEKAGFTFHSVESFSNGFEFESINISDCKNVDEEGNAETYQSVSIDYINGEGRKLALNITPAEFAGEDEALAESYDLNGRNCSYGIQPMKLLPQDYIMSEEEKLQQADGSVWFSTGDHVQEVTELTWHIMNWSDEENFYSLSTDEIEFTGEEMFAMAKEIMEK